MFLRVSKYPPNAIFRNVNNINAQHANVTGSMIWHTNPRSPMLVIYEFICISNGRFKFFRQCNCERSEFLVSSMARIFYIIIIVSEASFLVSSMARIFYYCERSELSGLFNARIFYMYISGRTSCRKCSKCFYVYLNAVLTVNGERYWQYFCDSYCRCTYKLYVSM